MLYTAFPSDLKEDLDIVQRILPKKISACDSAMSYTLNNGKIVEIPYRIYLSDIDNSEYDILTPTQKQLLCCIYTRSSDGYVREKYLRKLLDMSFEGWSIPFIVKLCDEYVLEILEIIYCKLKERNNEDIKSFCLINKASTQKSYSRMISYWNEFYREYEFSFRKYIGRSLFRDCLGYDRTFEK
ncbi:MAG: hypothetical protein U0L18_03470 [Acutalibacteraceae bacterium]|nr:hypothetical protein [Acutalibacteraceae bacterium]